MDVILKTNITNLGEQNDLVSVKDGYARNFLIPKKLAVIATASVKKAHEEIVKQRAHKEEKIRKEADELVEKIKDVKLSIPAKTSSKGKIFGSVNNIQIAEALKKEGHEIERKNITIKEEPIKEVGNYTAHVKVYRDITVDVPFEVFTEKE
jgi:large subunit ribosomal protein L9